MRSEDDDARDDWPFYAYEAVTQGFLPGGHDDFIAQDSYFTLLRARRVQFLDITRGYPTAS
jgi:hypothetical protein